MFTLNNFLFCVHFGVVVNAASQCCGRYVYGIWNSYLIRNNVWGQCHFWLIVCKKKFTGHGKHLVPIGMYKNLFTIRYITNPKWCALSSINGIMVDKWFWEPFGFFITKISQKFKENILSTTTRCVRTFCSLGIRQHSQRTGLVRVFDKDRGFELFDLTLTQ